MNLISFPAPACLSYIWNFGSLLSLILVVQIVSGVLVASVYAPLSFTFDLRVYNFSWITQSVHSNGASLFFLLLFSHLGRSLYYNLSRSFKVWSSGITIFVLAISTAFSGYILPWGQMSYWGATVITTLFSALPYVGPTLISWLWGGYSITLVTVVRFYSLHYLLPFIILFMVSLHLIFLHEEGSSNSLGVSSWNDSVPFHPLYVIKDLVTVLSILGALGGIVLYSPYVLMDPDNFVEANSMTTPNHIQPEWYFLYAYAILRSVPSNLSGVFALVSSLTFLFTLPWLTLGNSGLIHNSVCWFIFVNFLTLTWVGGHSVDFPYESIGQVLTFMYFFLLAIL